MTKCWTEYDHFNAPEEVTKARARTEHLVSALIID
jgi:hypothetical protein